jgi:hypothetical protein
MMMHEALIQVWCLLDSVVMRRTLSSWETGNSPPACQPFCFFLIYRPLQISSASFGKELQIYICMC